MKRTKKIRYMNIQVSYIISFYLYVDMVFKVNQKNYCWKTIIKISYLTKHSFPTCTVKPPNIYHLHVQSLN